MLKVAFYPFSVLIKMDLARGFALTAGSLTRNQVTYSAGRKINVRTVATKRPPMIAKAIGPQNMVGAIGIIPSTVDIAVSMIGRKRDIAASTTASHIALP